MKAALSRPPMAPLLHRRRIFPGPGVVGLQGAELGGVERRRPPWCSVLISALVLVLPVTARHLLLVRRHGVLTTVELRHLAVVAGAPATAPRPAP